MFELALTSAKPARCQLVSGSVAVIFRITRLAATLSHAGEVRAVVARAAVVVNIDLHAAATPFGYLGVGAASISFAAAVFGSLVGDTGHNGTCCLWCYSLGSVI